MAALFEGELGDLPRAFTALTAAVREDPADFSTVDEAERLADAADGWAELISDVSEVAREMGDAELAAAYWTRLGRWYHKELSHHEYAVAAYREALRKDAQHELAYEGIADIYRSQQKWLELTDVLAKQLEVAADADRKLEIYLALGDIFESQLAQRPRALEAYSAAAELDTDIDDALLALERPLPQGGALGQAGERCRAARGALRDPGRRPAGDGDAPGARGPARRQIG